MGRVRVREIKGIPIKLAQRKAELEAKQAKFDEGFLKAMYVDFMSDPINRVDKDSRKKFCNIYRCPPGLISVWERNPEIQKEVRVTVRERFGYGERIKELYDELWDQCRMGRISAIKLALELTGEYVPKMQHIDKPKSLEDMLDRMDSELRKEDSDAKIERPSKRLN